MQVQVQGKQMDNEQQKTWHAGRLRGKVTVEEEGTVGKERREFRVTGGKMKGRKEVRVDVSKGKSITGMMTGRKEAGKTGTTEKEAGRKVNDQVYATRRS